MWPPILNWNLEVFKNGMRPLRANCSGIGNVSMYIISGRESDLRLLLFSGIQKL